MLLGSIGQINNIVQKCYNEVWSGVSINSNDELESYSSITLHFLRVFVLAYRQVVPSMAYQIILPPGSTKERLKVFVARPLQILKQLPAGYEVTGLERIDGEEHEQGRVPHFVHPDKGHTFPFACQ
jgi:hypothetical protein